MLGMRRVLASLSYSFLIVGVFLAWQAYRGMKGELGVLGPWQVTLLMVGAVFSVVLGLSGVRQRHRDGE